MTGYWATLAFFDLDPRHNVRRIQVYGLWNLELRYASCFMAYRILLSVPDRQPSQKPQLYWRGMSTGGMIVGDNYHRFMRFKLADIGREHPDLMDIFLTRVQHNRAVRSPIDDQK
ncbi:hypothetical protein B0H11DRAFT_1945121 [Mycena galericulata]|nr:hypothetical protein B0H11DRAFT_1945121 [Mycena galericulata]